jgi:hypothetical protein
VRNRDLLCANNRCSNLSNRCYLYAHREISSTGIFEEKNSRQRGDGLHPKQGLFDNKANKARGLNTKQFNHD